MDYYTENRGTPDKIENLFQCHLQDSIDQRPVVSAHIHEYYEVLYCLDGSYKLYADGKYYDFSAGDLALIDPMQVHQVVSTSDGLNRYIVVQFVADVLFYTEKTTFELKYLIPYQWMPSSHTTVFHSDELKTDSIGNIITEVLQEYLAKNYGYEMACRLGISRFFLWVLRRWNNEHTAQGIDQKLEDSTLLQLQKAFSYIDENYAHDIRMDQVAHICGMSYTAFSRFFSKYSRQSFPDYLTSVRLQKASIALATSDKSITEIAMDVGFSTTSYFIQRFREVNGVSPGHFRRQFTSN